MKKLNLQLNGKEMLTKEQMKVITGGYMTGCVVTCGSWGQTYGVINTTTCNQDDADDMCDATYSSWHNYIHATECNCYYS